jgi:hypothetical protein
MPYLEHSQAHKGSFLEHVEDALSILNDHFIASQDVCAAAQTVPCTILDKSHAPQCGATLKMKQLPCKVPEFIIPDCRIEWSPERSNTKVNKFSVSFEPESCQTVQILSFDIEILNQIFTNNLRVSAQEEKHWQSIQGEFKKQADFIKEKLPYTALGTSSLSMNHKQMVKYILHTMECFAGLDFDFHNLNHSYQISFCDSSFLYKQMGFAGYGFFGGDGMDMAHGNTSCVILDSTFSQSLGHAYDMNTLAHEMMHILGFGHVKYNSQEENVRFRSVVDDAEGVDSFAMQRCRALAKKMAKAATKENKQKFFACLNTPFDLQPIDVIALIEQYGPSQDQSVFCQTARQLFAELHPNEVELIPGETEI